MEHKTDAFLKRGRSRCLEVESLYYIIIIANCRNMYHVARYLF